MSRARTMLVALLTVALLAVVSVTSAAAQDVWPPIGTDAYNETCYLLQGWGIPAAHCTEDDLIWVWDFTGEWTCDGLPGWGPTEGPLPYCPDNPNDPRGKA